MKKEIMVRSCVTLGLLVVFLFLLTHCGGSNGSGIASQEADAADTTTSTLTDVAGSSLNSLAGGLSGSTSVKSEVSDGSSETDAEEGDDESRSGSKQYNCSYNEEERSQVCQCPGGGTVTHTFDDEVVIAKSLAFDHTVKTVFDQCVVMPCAKSKTLDGELTGHVSGVFDPVGKTTSLTFTQKTAELCAGLNIDDVKVGLDLTIAFDGSGKSVSGSICFDPPGEPIYFDSLGELKRLLGPDDFCSARDRELGDQSDR